MRRRAAGELGPQRSRSPGIAPALPLLLALPWLAAWSFFDPFHENVEKGNREAGAGEAEEALARYGEAARVDPGSPIPDFNRGIVLSKEGRVEEARDAFLGAAVTEDSGVAADALYNLGNVLLDAEQYEPAVEAYLRSLDLDPEDADTRKNLEIALRRLEQQQQQQQDEEQQEQEQQEDEGEDEQQQPPEDEQPQDSEDETPGEQDEEEQDQEEPEPQPGEQERMSREDAERLLNAIQSDELKVLQQLLDQQEEQKGIVTNDW